MNIDDVGPAANSPPSQPPQQQQPQSSSAAAAAAKAAIGIVASTVHHQPLPFPLARPIDAHRDVPAALVIASATIDTVNDDEDGSVFSGTGTAERSTPSPLSASGRRSRLRTYGGDRSTTTTTTGFGGSGGGSIGSCSSSLSAQAFSTARRVSFPENDAELVTGYLEPANPWATGEQIC